MFFLQQMREVEYSKPLDADFKKFLDQKKRGKSAKENMDDRAGALITEDLVEEAKRFGYFFTFLENIQFL